MVLYIFIAFTWGSSVMAQDIAQDSPIVDRPDKVETPKYYQGLVCRLTKICQKNRQNTPIKSVVQAVTAAIKPKFPDDSNILIPQGETFENQWIMKQIELKQQLTSAERNYLIALRKNAQHNPLLWQNTYDYSILQAWRESEYQRSRGIMADDLLNSSFDKMIAGKIGHMWQSKKKI